MAKVYISRNIYEPAPSMLAAKGYEIVTNPEDRVLTKDELIAALKKEKPDAMLCLLTDHIDADVLDAAPQLKIIANYAVGFDNISLDEAKKRNIAVSNTPSLVVADSVAEHTFALMLAVAHRIVEGDNFARAGRYKAWDPYLLTGSLLAGKTLGVLGLGRIGAGVVHRAVNGMNMKVRYYDIKPNKELEEHYGAVFSTIDEVLSQSDVISLHVPLTKETRHMLSTRQFGQMKKGAFLVNTARGPVVDEKAALEALKAGTLAGFGLDVFECEPNIDCDPFDNLELKTQPNVVMTPHIASATLEARQDMAKIAAENIIAALEGKTPPNLAKI